MYRNLLEKSDFKKYISNEFEIYAHKKEKEKESLDKHLNLCKKYFEKILIDKNIEDIYVKFENVFLIDCSETMKELYREMLISVITMHDMGKLNIVFQKYKMNNDLKIEGLNHRMDTKHSIYSSIIYIDIYFRKILDIAKSEKLSNEHSSILLSFLILNSYLISIHHGGFGDIDEYLAKLDGLSTKENIETFTEVIKDTYVNEIRINNKIIKTIIKGYREYANSIKNYENKNICLFIYERLNLSLLIAADYYATSEFMTGTEISDMGSITEIDEVYSIYKSGGLYKSIRSYETDKYGTMSDFSDVSDINVMRNELFLDSEKKLISNYHKDIFYLEAPTGSGKSNVANNLAYKLMELDKTKNKIFYVYPFNTLIEQNLETLKKIYSDNINVINKIAVINSLFPVKVVKEQELEDIPFEEYQKALLNRQFLNYPIVLTTHVSFFRYLFGCHKDDIFPVHQLVNSVIVLDEIQSYKNIIWREIIEFLKNYAHILNIKIIIMSATLPDLDLLLLKKGSSVKLIDNREKYFANPIFKNRVTVDYSLLSIEVDYEKLFDKMLTHKGRKILIEFITKKSAYEFYRYLLQKQEMGDLQSKVRLITGDDNTIERENILTEIRNTKDIILVSTQVIEAGVDIDMDIGFKNISIFDSEEQFLGRINRSCLKRDSVVYFFKYDSVEKIYKKDVRVNSDLLLTSPKMKEIFINKDFNKFYSTVIERILNNTNMKNELNTEDFIREEVGKLKFKSIENKMKLIDNKENDISIFINYTLCIDGEDILGSNIWQEYKKLLKSNNLNYAEKYIKLSIIKSKMNYFIYKIKNNNNFCYDDRIGEILYIENGYEYFIDGKLDKAKFESGVGEFI